MKRILTAALALATLAAVPAAALADDDRGRGKKKGHDKHDRRDYDKQDDRRAFRQLYRDDRRPYVRVQPPRDYAQRIWRRGQVLPYDFRRTVIYDPYRYGLYAPPRGHAWVHVDNDVYLTQLGTGLIVEVLRDSYF